MDMKTFKSHDEIAWCKGCGDFGILNAVKKALIALEKRPEEVLLVSGIGQAAKLPHYINVNCFNGLHGRALPAAIGAKLANRELSVIVTTGDGDCYGEGGNHFLHNIRRNPDITVIVHDNQIYGLTKGQASPTTDAGYVTRMQPEGVILNPFQPLQLAIAAGCGFVARAFSKNVSHLAGLIAEAVAYPGFALIDVLQPCVTFNKKNTYQWYSQRLVDLASEPEYESGDKFTALKKAEEWGDKIPVGVLYKAETISFEKKSGLDKLPPLIELPAEEPGVEGLLGMFR